MSLVGRMGLEGYCLWAAGPAAPTSAMPGKQQVEPSCWGRQRHKA